MPSAAREPTGKLLVFLHLPQAVLPSSFLSTFHVSLYSSLPAELPSPFFFFQLIFRNLNPS